MISTRNLVESGRRVVESVAFYPLTAVYVGSSGALISVSSGTISLVQGLGALAFLTALAMLASTRRELRRVHVVINEAHATLRARNVELQLLLEASNRQWELLMETARVMEVRRNVQH